MQITNCHTHTFTSQHTPDRFLPWPVGDLARFGFVRRLLSWLAWVFDRSRQSALGRYAQIMDTSFKKSQAQVFEVVRGFYPEGTRFVVLPMDMTFMGAGSVPESIDLQHEQLAKLRRTAGATRSGGEARQRAGWRLRRIHGTPRTCRSGAG